MNPVCVGRVQTHSGVAKFHELEAFYCYVDYMVENGLGFQAFIYSDKGWRPWARSVCWGNPAPTSAV